MSFTEYVTTDAGMIRNDMLKSLKDEKVRRDKYHALTYGKNYGKFKYSEHFDSILKHVQKTLRVDANETQLLARQLIYVFEESHNVIHPGDILEQAAPINNRGGTGLIAVSYKILDQTGRFKLVSGHAKDLPTVGSTLREQQQSVGVYGGLIQWSQIDAERARRGDIDEATRLAEAALTSAKKTKNQVFWNGDPDGGDTQGVFNSALNPVTIVGGWATATNLAILKDCQKVINQCQVTTEELRSDILVMDTTSYSYMTGMLENSGGESIGGYLMAKNGIKAILTTSYLNSVTSPINSLSADAVIMAYPRNKTVLEFSLPRDVQQFPFQQDGIMHSAPLLLDTAGALVYHPQAIAYAIGM